MDLRLAPTIGTNLAIESIQRLASNSPASAGKRLESLSAARISNA
jgi:hypothetical protein